MAGYSRQSAADIIASAIIRAAPVNAEYNAIRDAFAFATGHKHDGSSTEGAYIPLIADTDAKNKVVVDTTNNRISVYSEVGGSAVEQLRIQDGAIVPVTDDDIDLGASGAEFKDLYIDGIGYIDTLAVHENATIAGTLNVTGVITAPGGLVADITGDITGDVTGNVTGDLTGDVTSTGTSTFSDLDAVDLSATGTTVITSGDINSGTIDNSVIGAATPAAGTFTTIDANTSLTAATADINGGTIDGATIGATSHTTGKFTTLQSTGQATLNTVDINGGNIDGTVIGAVGTAAGSFTTLSTSGQATLATVNIDGGAIDGTTIGASSAATGAFTTVTASGGVTADVTGNLTGNVTGNVTGDITGDVTGDLSGNVTSTGSSSFNNVTIDGTLNMNAGTTATITNLTSPTNTNDAATKGYVDTQVSNLVDSAPGTLDTLNELAAALGDDPDFATTVTDSIATKLPLAGGTMTGAIAMSTNKITGAGDPTAAQDVATKAYVDTQDGLQVTKSGDTMSGNLAMGSNKVTGLAAPTDANDATTKTYVDAILGSGSDAAASAAAAATSETNAATSETNASNSASAAATSEANAAASYDNFDDRYLGAKSTAPTVDNDGDALIVGALYFNNTTNIMNVYGSGGWQSAGSAVNGTSDRNTYTATAGQTVFAATYDTGYVDVYLNGVKLISGTDFTATNGTSITLTTGAAVNDVVDIVAYGTFVLADHYTSSQSDARYVEVAGDTMTGGLNVTGGSVGIGTSSPAKQLHIESSTGGTLRLSSSDASVGAGESLGQIDWYSNDASGSGSGVRAFVNVVENDGGLGRAYDMTFGTGQVATATERMRIDSSGNLLVGTTTYSGASSPQNSSSSADAGTVIESGGTVQIGRYQNSPLRLNRMNNDGDILDFRKDGSTVGSIGTTGGQLSVGNSDTGLLFNAASESIYPWNTSTGAIRDAAIDLGKSNDRFKDLYLSGDVDTSGVFKGTNGTASAPTHSFLNDPDNGMFRPTTNTIGFSTAGSEAMRIDASGSVGIGTSSPSSQLSLHGDVSTAYDGTGISSATYQQHIVNTNNDANTGAFLALSSNDNGTGTAVIGSIGGSTLKDSQLVFLTRDGSASGDPIAERMRIDSSGNVIVNANAGTSDAGTVRITGGTSGLSNLQFADTADGNIGMLQYNHASNHMLFQVNNSEAMRIDSSGNVGIGTSSGGSGPQDDLHISSSLPTIRLEDNDVAGGAGYSLIHTSSNGNLEFKADPDNVRSSTDIRFHVDGAESMRIDSSGNLLVGQSSTTQPGVGNTTTGFGIRNDGLFFASAYNGRTGTFSRSGTDGTILGIYKDGSSVGSIGNASTNLIIEATSSNRSGLSFGGSITPRRGGANSDNAVDLGSGSYRFKDAYFSGTVNAANFNTTSDGTLKTNVETLSGSLDAVTSLRGVSFDWLDNGGSEIGVIAQEVEAVLPDVVSTNDEGIKSVKYGNMVAVLIEAIKEQQLRIEALEAQLNS